MSYCVVAIASITALGPFCSSACGQTKKEEAALLATPAADLITTEFLAPAVRQAVANGVATLMARMTAEGNDHGLAFPPNQSVTYEPIEVRAKRVQRERPVYEILEVEVVEPVMESGQPTGRFAKVKRKVHGKKIGTKTVEELVADENGSEMMKTVKRVAGGPAAWAVNLPGLNGMALYVLTKAGLGEHPATAKHAAALADHCSQDMGLPDHTFNVAWMAAGFASLGPDSPHAGLSRRLVAKLIDGQIREKGELDGLWGPICVNYGYFGKLMTLGQTVRQELDVHIPKKMETASPAEQQKLIAMGKQMREFATIYEKTHRDVFRAGTRMLNIEKAYAFEDRAVLPGMPYNAYQWVVSDVESTEAAVFAIAVAKQSGLLPRETDRLSIRGKKIHPAVKTEAALEAAAKRMASAIDDDGGTTALALVAENKGFEKTGFSAPAFRTAEAMPPMFDFQTACTSAAAQETLESLVAVDAALDKPLAEPRKRARDRVEKIAARWYKESADPTADTWKGIHASLKVSHAALKKSAALEKPSAPGTSIESLPWGPSGALYRIVPGFRGLFVGAKAEDRYANDLFRQIAYRLVALQDDNGQWSSAGNLILSTASESLTIGRVATYWHSLLDGSPPVKVSVPDPVSFELMLLPTWHGGWRRHRATSPDAAVVPTLASLIFLLDSIDCPVSLDGITILPPPSTEPSQETDPDKPPMRLTPADAARQVMRPSAPRQELFDAIIASRWPRKAVREAAASGKPEKQPSEGEQKPNEEREDAGDDVGTFEDFLEPAGS